jgi:hypothetical protein
MASTISIKEQNDALLRNIEWPHDEGGRFKRRPVALVVFVIMIIRSFICAPGERRER